MNKVKTVKIGERSIGDGHPCFIIAEAGCNHNGDLGLARKLIDMAVEAKADVVKFQTYNADTMYSKKTPMIKHIKERVKASENSTMYDLIKMTELPYDMHKPIVEYCRERRMPFVSTPFSEYDVDFLEQFNVPCFKIASFEMTHFPLLRKVAATKKPVVISTGMSTLGDIERVLSIFYQAGNDNVVLLHCVSNYPAKPEEMNLRAIPTLKNTFGYPVGLSDHTPGIEVPKIAMAIGANAIEKHITIDQSLPGPDHYFSLTPDELNGLTKAARDIETWLGSPRKHVTERELEMKRIARRSLVAGASMKAGTIVKPEMLAVKRPGMGLDPGMMEVLVGKKVVRDIELDDPLTWDMFMPS